MSDSVNSRSGGIGFSGLLTIVFIVLKLCNVITWNWVWVLSPFWIGIVLTFLFYFIVSCIEFTRRKK